MEKENGSEDVSAEIVEDVKEAPVEEAKGLSLRDALDVAFEASTPQKEVDAEESPQKITPTTPSVPALTAPAEWNKEEKEDFGTSTRKQQEASLRLHKSRQSTLEQIKRESAELEWSRELAKEATPYLKSVGEKLSSHEAIIRALKMRNEFEYEDPRKSVASFLQAKGLTLEDLSRQTPEAVQDEKLTPLQERLNQLENRVAQEDHAKAEFTLGSAWSEFEQEKNAGGKPKYPDILNEEAGLKIATEIGSLVGGHSDLSKQFISLAKTRIPDLTYPKLLSEAYRFLGGTVDDSEAPRTQDKQQHVQQSRRAASSRPGGSTQSASVSTGKKLSYREAIAQALADLNQE